MMFIFVPFKMIKFVFPLFFISICFYYQSRVDMICFYCQSRVCHCYSFAAKQFKYRSRLLGIFLFKQFEVIEKNGRQIVSTSNFNHASFVMLMLIRHGNISAFGFARKYANKCMLQITLIIMLE